jgi:hypothetical protein
MGDRMRLRLLNVLSFLGADSKTIATTVLRIFRKNEMGAAISC